MKRKKERIRIMSPVVLLNDSNKYNGKYVAMESFVKREVICASANPDKAIEKAKKQGYENPVIFYVPKKGTVNIFSELYL